MRPAYFVAFIMVSADGIDPPFNPLAAQRRRHSDPSKQRTTSQASAGELRVPAVKVLRSESEGGARQQLDAPPCAAEMDSLCGQARDSGASFQEMRLCLLAAPPNALSGDCRGYLDLSAACNLTAVRSVCVPGGEYGDSSSPAAAAACVDMAAAAHSVGKGRDLPRDFLNMSHAACATALRVTRRQLTSVVRPVAPAFGAAAAGLVPRVGGGSAPLSSSVVGTPGVEGSLDSESLVQEKVNVPPPLLSSVADVWAKDLAKAVASGKNTNDHDEDDSWLWELATGDETLRTHRREVPGPFDSARAGEAAAWWNGPASVEVFQPSDGDVGASFDTDNSHGADEIYLGESDRASAAF